MAEITFETFGRKTKNAANALQNGTAKIVHGQSADLASDVARAYRVAAGGDGRLSGTAGVRKGNGKQAPVSAKAKDVRKYSDGTYVGLVVPTGPYGLLEADIAPHVIAPGFTAKQIRSTLRKARKNRMEGQSAVLATQIARAGLAGRASKGLRVPGNYTPKKGKATGVFAIVSHPGTKGKPVFSRSIAVSGPQVAEGLCVEAVKKVVAGYKAGT